jgi:predicted transcriptional regulator
MFKSINGEEKKSIFQDKLLKKVIEEIKNGNIEEKNIQKVYEKYDKKKKKSIENEDLEKLVSDIRGVVFKMEEINKLPTERKIIVIEDLEYIFKMNDEKENVINYVEFKNGLIDIIEYYFIDRILPGDIKKHDVIKKGFFKF